MKCVKPKYENLPNGKKADMTIERCADGKAARLVEICGWTYVPKSEWKAQQRAEAETTLDRA